MSIETKIIWRTGLYKEVYDQTSDQNIYTTNIDYFYDGVREYEKNSSQKTPDASLSTLSYSTSNSDVVSCFHKLTCKYKSSDENFMTTEDYHIYVARLTLRQLLTEGLDHQ